MNLAEIGGVDVTLARLYDHPDKPGGGGVRQGRLSEQEAAIFQQNTIRFLDVVAAFNSHTQIPDSVNKEEWEGDIEMVLRYYIDGASLRDIKSQTGLSPTTVTTRISKTLDTLWNQTAAKAKEAGIDDFEEKFPRNTIGRGTPVTVAKRRTFSKTGGGSSAIIHDVLKANPTITFYDLEQTTGIPPCKIGRTRPILKGWGENVPRKLRKPIDRKELIEQLTTPSNDDDIRDQLEKIDLEQAYGYYKRRANLKSVAEIARGAFKWSPKNHQKFVDVLQTANFPMRTLKFNKKIRGKVYEVSISFTVGYLENRALKILAEEAAKNDSPLKKYLLPPTNEP